jgi:hypothetical protein
VKANTFGPLIELTDPVFGLGGAPVVAYDDLGGRALLAGSAGCVLCRPRIVMIDLDDGARTEVETLGLGFVNGVALDAGSSIACTTTEIDFKVEFYDLAAGTVVARRLPGATSQAQSGRDVAFDPLHGLFLVGQTVSSTAPGGSSIHVFDTAGNLVESIDGLSLPASSAHIALVPAARRGFVVTAPELTSLQSFTY